MTGYPPQRNLALDAARWAAVRALFEELADRPEADRVGRLTQTQAVDPELAAAVVQMLAAERAGADTEELSPDTGFRSAALIADAVRPAAPTQIGQWRLINELGAGGMGTVYLAERDSQGVLQRAAVKLLRLGQGDAAARRRFVAEQRMLASLHHPNIAHLIEAGVDAGGQPYLALEYVDGVDLLRHAREQALDLGARIQLFRLVCVAVEHAHQQLIVHRDLKPGNILVTADGTVKLLDFGIGKLLSELDAGAGLTGTGVRMFTLGYGAPEQLRGEPVSTATDVYALGVVLYKLVTGHLPFEVSSHSVLDWERAMLTREPTPPSRRAATDTNVAARSPKFSLRGWQGDLDAIVMKALRREPAQRYPGVGALREDLSALLAQRPISARRGSRRYRLSKFLRRNAMGLSLSGVAGLSLLTGTAVALWQAAQARAERAQAQESARRAEATVEFLTNVFASADPGESEGRNPSARALLAAGVARLDTASDLDPATRATLFLAMARAYRGLGDGATQLQLTQQAQAQAQASGSVPLRIDALVQLGIALNNLGQRNEALAQLQTAEKLLVGSGLADPLRQARIDELMAAELTNLDRVSEALERIDRAHATLVHRLGAGDQRVANALDVHVVLLNDVGRQAEGVAVTAPSAAAAAADHEMPGLRRSLIFGSHALALHYAGRFDEAEPYARQSLALKEGVLGPDHPDLSGVLSKLMVIQASRGQLRDALQFGERLLAIKRRHDSPPSRRLAASLASVARIAVLAQDWTRADALLAEARAGYDAPSAPRSAHRLRIQLLQAQVWLANGRDEDARRLLAAIAPHLDQMLSDDRPIARRLLSESSGRSADTHR